MLYVFTGTDEIKVRKKAFEWVALARTKAPDALYVKIDGSALTHEHVEEITSSSGLFYQKMLVVLDEPLVEEGTREVVFDNLPRLVESNNAILVIASKILAKDKKLKEVAQKVFEFDRAPSSEGRGFNSALVNALGARNTTALWQEIVLSCKRGDAPEALHGLLHWKVRDMIQKGSRAWSREEARKLSRDLILLLSESRKGNLTLSQSLEYFALSL